MLEMNLNNFFWCDCSKINTINICKKKVKENNEY